jgi:hypothetical protein
MRFCLGEEYRAKLTMSRWLWFSFCAIIGLVMLVLGLLVPAHLRAVDESVIQNAGHNTPALIEQGMALVGENKLGAAQLLLRTAQREQLAGTEKLEYAVNDLARQHPGWVVWGGPEPRFEGIFENESKLHDPGFDPFTEYVVRMENRERVLGFLSASRNRLVQELLRFRLSTNTVVFPPSQSAAGQALDAALSTCGLLVEGGHLTSNLSNALMNVALTANQGGNSQLFEDVLMNLLSLGQRFNWGQLVVFMGNIQDPETLRLQTILVRKADRQLPILFSAVQLSGEPRAVAKYVMDYSQTGLADLGTAMRFGAGGVGELLRRHQRLDASVYTLSQVPPLGTFSSLAATLTWKAQWLAMAFKWALYLCAGFLFAAALHFARPPVSALEEPLQVRGFHIAREGLFALGFLALALLVSEPFLAQDNQKVEFPFHLRLPTVGSVLVPESNNIKSAFMNQLNLLTLLLFFVLQGLLYIACLVKLAEIRRQRVPSRVRLRLLENEDHLFDAGLYLGFVGTIISLILVSIGVVKFSLMAAYSSTSFGIIFVSIFKIFHLRPTRRKLLLESEAAAESVAPAHPTFATTP